MTRTQLGRMDRWGRVPFWLVLASFSLVSLSMTSASAGSLHAAAECQVNEDEPGDDQYASIAKRVPAFGGLYVDGETLYIWLTDDGRSLDAAFQEILSLPHHYLADLTPVALPAQYSYTQLFCWQYGEMLEVESTLEYIYTGIDDARNRLTVAVEDLAKQGPAWRARLVEVGIPLEAVDIIEEEKPVMFAPGPAGSFMPRPEPFRPVPASQSPGGILSGIAIGLVVAVGVSAAFFARRRMRRADQGLDSEALLPRDR